MEKQEPRKMGDVKSGRKDDCSVWNGCIKKFCETRWCANVEIALTDDLISN